MLRGPFCANDGWAREPFDLGSFRIEQPGRAHGPALVFEARQQGSAAHFTVYLLRPELVGRVPGVAERFTREARAAARLEHEHVASVVEVGLGETADTLFAVIEADGPTLAEVVARGGALPWQRAARILRQVAGALSYAHSAGVSHGALSASQIGLALVGDRDFAKVRGLGLHLLGAAHYGAEGNSEEPGEPEFEPEADVAPLGRVAYLMLTGIELGDTAADGVKIDFEEIAAPIQERIRAGEIPAELGLLTMRCLRAGAAGQALTAAQIEARLAELSTGGAAKEVTLEGRMIGSYRVVSLLGVGGMGSVYRAEHPVIGTQVAIKVLHKEIGASTEVTERFTREARASSTIKSPHIPRFFDFGRLDDGRHYAVMEYLEGETIDARIQREGPFSVRDAARLLVQAAAALHEAHRADIIHRDIKPENLFIARTDDGGEMLKVLDFGIAKSNVGATGAKLTRVGTFMGTPAYCAPEQIYAHPVTAASDIYSLGATAYEMLTGRPPFDGDVTEILEAKVSCDPPPIRSVRPDMPERVAASVLAMVARSPRERPGSMEMLRSIFESWLEASEPTVQRVSVSSEHAAPRRSPWPLLGGGLAIVLLLGGVTLAVVAVTRDNHIDVDDVPPPVTRETANAGTQGTNESGAHVADLPLGLNPPDPEPEVESAETTTSRPEGESAAAPTAPAAAREDSESPRARAMDSSQRPAGSAVGAADSVGETRAAPRTTAPRTTRASERQPANNAQRGPLIADPFAE